MSRQNSAGFEAKYREFPEDALEHCADKVQFMAEVALLVPCGEDLTLSPRATNGLYRLLCDISKEMQEISEEVRKQI